MTSIVLKTNVDQAVRNEVVRQLKIARFDLAYTGKALSGRIDSFSVSDVGSPAVWTLKIHYVIRDMATQQILYAATKTARQSFPKFTNATIALDDTVKQSMAALMDDPDFVRAVKS